MGRFGVAIHITAGFGDIGWRGTFTLEIVALHRSTVVYAGDEVAQVYFEPADGETYKQYSGGYMDQTGPRPPKAIGG